MEIALPLAHFDIMYHVGELDVAPPADRDSHEGACLSASHYPEEWGRIARIGGPLWRLHKPNATFMDFHRLGRKRRAALIKYAVSLGLLEPRLMWRISHFDDEIGETMMSLYSTFSEAAVEANFGTRPVPQRAHATTPLLTQRFLHRPEDGYAARQWAFMAVAEIAGLDGVWWDDDLDVSCYSAPRVGIFRSRLDGFARERVSLSRVHTEPIPIRTTRWRIELPDTLLEVSHVA